MLTFYMTIQLPTLLYLCNDIGCTDCVPITDLSSSTCMRSGFFLSSGFLALFFMALGVDYYFQYNHNFRKDIITENISFLSKTFKKFYLNFDLVDKGLETLDNVFLTMGPSIPGINKMILDYLSFPNTQKNGEDGDKSRE